MFGVFFISNILLLVSSCIGLVMGDLKVQKKKIINKTKTIKTTIESASGPK